MRRRLVWVQGGAEEPAMFFLYQGPDGYYVAKNTGPLQFVAPLTGIANLGFTAIGSNDWRFLARGGNDVDGYTILFYGPLGLLTTIPVPLPLLPEQSTATGSGVFAESYFNGTYLGETIAQRCWYTQVSSGCGPRIDPDGENDFVLPGVRFPTDQVGGGSYSNNDLTYAIRQGQLLSADGTLTATTGGPPTWPRYPNNNFTATMIGLTLFFYIWPGSSNTFITLTPHRYNPITGAATTGDSFAVQRVLPPAGYTLRHTSYWSANP